MNRLLDPVADEGRRTDARADRANAIAQAAQGLETEFIEAAYTSPRMTIPTPRFAIQRHELHEVVYDIDDAVVALLEIVRDAASGKAETAAAGARAWIAKEAKAFGAYHAADMVNGDE